MIKTAKSILVQKVQIPDLINSEERPIFEKIQNLRIEVRRVHYERLFGEEI